MNQSRLSSPSPTGDISIRPVFIIGAARSGTKFLRGILSFSRDCGVIPYDVNYIWRFGNERFPSDALPASSLHPKTREFIRRHLALMAQPRVPEGGMLIEKTVSNTLRVDYVNAVYPEGRFIQLVRDGRDVIESAVRMWNSPLDWPYLFDKLRQFPLANYRYAAWYVHNILRGRLSRRKGPRIWGPRYPGIEKDLASLSVAEVCARQWSESVRRTNEALTNIAGDRQMTVRYETLIRDLVEVERLCAFLGLSDPGRVADGYRQTLSPPRQTPSSPAAVGTDMKRAFAIAAPELCRLGYAVPDLQFIRMTGGGVK